MTQSEAAFCDSLLVPFRSATNYYLRALDFSRVSGDIDFAHRRSRNG